MEDEHHDQTEQHNHLDHHRMMIRDFQKRFSVTIVLSLPVPALSDLIQQFLGSHLTDHGLTKADRHH